MPLKPKTVPPTNSVPVQQAKPPVSAAPKTVPVVASASKLELPTEYNKPSDSLSDYVILLAGDKKIGKSALAAQFPNHIILEGEPGNAKHLKCRSIDITSWEKFMEALSLLENNPGYADTIIIDDVPSFSKLCETYFYKKRGIEHASDETHGKGWSALEFEFCKQFNRVQALPGGKIYTVHNAFKEFERKSGAKFSRLETSLNTQAERFMEKVVHLWAVLQYDAEGSRVMTIQGDEFIKAGCGIEDHFIDPVTKKKLVNIPLGDSAPEAYANLLAAWENRLPVGMAQDKAFVKTADFKKVGMGGKK